MIIKRFGFSKITEGEISTPKLLKCGKDVIFNGEYFEILGKRIRREILYPPEIGQREIKIDERMYLIPNIPTMLKNTKRFVDYTIKIRKKYGWDKLFYAPGVRANLYPILFYLGYDLFDDCYSKIENYDLWGKCEDANPEEIFNITVRAARKGKLREFVEGIPDNKSQEILRYLDHEYYGEMEKFYPIWMPELNAVTLQSLYRPDVVRWRKRLMERYRTPRYAKYLLLLPCSAKKPYSLSKTHKLIRQHVRATMHEVIITSPLGIVPRELEMFYPSQNYDTPTIGFWYEEEKAIIEKMLRWYLDEFEYEEIVSYLPESMIFLEDLLERYDAIRIWNNDVRKLEEVTYKIDYKVPRSEIVRENIKSVARFQFSCCEDLLDEAKIKGRYPKVDVLSEGERIFGFNPQKGMLTLTEKSSQRLLSERKYLVEIDNFYPEGDVFAAGIVNATHDIREGDEVVVAYEDELRAWGTARMGYYDMITQDRGKAVKVRGRKK